MSKELFVDSFQEIYDKLVEGGCPAELAYEIASEKAYERMRESVADMIDLARMRAKDGETI